tara:strand:- start:1143 stop:1886 length:744 start_codon:yes stop_codon:yes gene_type:complete
MDSSEIISNKNKYKLWDDFNGKGFFNNTINEDFESIQKIFEESIISIHNKYEKLKIEDIEKINDEIETIFKKNMTIFNEQKRAKQIEDHRMNNLSKLMKNKQNEMDEILNPVKPNEINFSNETNDEPFKEDMEEIINKTLENRQKELSTIMASMPAPILENENENYIIDNSPHKNINNNSDINKKILESQIKIIELLETIHNDNILLKKTIDESQNNNKIHNELIEIKKEINILKNKKILKQKKDKI